MDYIKLEGIRVYAYHGCLEEEKKIGGEFELNVWLGMDLKKAGREDKIGYSVDYAKVNEIIRDEMQVPSKLLEGIAYRILNKLEQIFPQVSYIRLEVSKLHPPVPGEMEKVSVVLESGEKKGKKS